MSFDEQVLIVALTWNSNDSTVVLNLSRIYYVPFFFLLIIFYHYIAVFLNLSL